VNEAIAQPRSGGCNGGTRRLLDHCRRLDRLQAPHAPAAERLDAALGADVAHVLRRSLAARAPLRVEDAAILRGLEDEAAGPQRSSSSPYSRT
jgi:hypothetical protein